LTQTSEHVRAAVAHHGGAVDNVTFLLVQIRSLSKFGYGIAAYLNSKAN